jgi:YesN/AraC family two-component response regulator
MTRILIIDDDVQIREMLRQMLEFENYEVVEAGNGKEALRIQQQTPADLVITDLIMPEKEGIETIRELREIFPEIKIIAMSGGGVVGPESYLKIAKSLGAQKTFVKPIERKILLEGIREVLA